MKIKFLVFTTIFSFSLCSSQNIDTYKKRLIEEYLELIDIKQIYMNQIDQFYEHTEKNVPLFKDNMDLFLNYFSKIGSWDTIRTELMMLYADEYSEAELKDIIQLHKSPFFVSIKKRNKALIKKHGEKFEKRVFDGIILLVDSIKNRMLQSVADTMTTGSDSLDATAFFTGTFIYSKPEFFNGCIVRNKKVQYEYNPVMKSKSEYKIEWKNKREYDLVFVSSTKEKIPYSVGERFNVLITEITPQGYSCVVTIKGKRFAYTLYKIQ